MSDRAMSEEAMLASLRGIQLPELAPVELVADIAVTVGLSALAALLVAALLRLASRRRETRIEPTLHDELARLQALPEAERRIAALHLLRAHAPDRYAAMQGALYRPDGIATRTLEAEVARLV